MSKGTDACGTFSSGAKANAPMESMKRRISQADCGAVHTGSRPGNPDLAFVVLRVDLWRLGHPRRYPRGIGLRQQFPCALLQRTIEETHLDNLWKRLRSRLRRPTARFCRGRAENSSSCRINPWYSRARASAKRPTNCGVEMLSIPCTRTMEASPPYFRMAVASH